MAIAFRRARAIALLAGLAAACRAAPPGQLSPDPIGGAEAKARAAIQDEQALGAQTAPPRSVGVTPFGTNVTDTTLAPLSYGLADLLLTDLARARQLVVVDRLQLGAVLRELQLVSAGRVDSAGAPRVGRLVQARSLVLGSLSQLPDSQLRIDARVADVATSSTGTPLPFSAPINAILDAEKALAFRLLDELGVTLTPAERAAIEQRPTRNLAALLAFSKGVQYELGALSGGVAQFGAAAGAYETALRLDPSFAGAREHLTTVRAHIAALDRSRSASNATRNSLRSVVGVALEQVASIGQPGIPDRPGGPADPAFPSNRATIVVVVVAP